MKKKKSVQISYPVNMEVHCLRLLRTDTRHCSMTMYIDLMRKKNIHTHSWFTDLISSVSSVAYLSDLFIILFYSKCTFIHWFYNVSQKSTFHYVENELWNLIPKQFKGVSRTSQLYVLFVFQIYAHNDALFRSHQSYLSLSPPSATLYL